MNADGTGLIPLTKLTSFAQSVSPTWSPDGQKIAYAANRALDGSDAPGNVNVWITNADGSGTTPLTKLAVAFSCTPSWSPDGTQIAFNSTRVLDGRDASLISSGNPPFSISNIWVMRVDGSGVAPITRLTQVSASPPGGCPELGKDAPVWSTDGSQLAFASPRPLDGSDGPRGSVDNIWVIKKDGSSAMPLTRLTATPNANPVWRPK